MPDVASQDFVTGILVRVAWSDLEPVEGAPSWTLLDNELALAKQYGKKVALAVVNGSSAPAWLAAKGTQMFAYSFRGSPMTMPVPWDSLYLSAWTNFIAKLGARYRDDPTITLVHITHSTLNGFEMQIPFSPQDQQAWQQIGYTADRHIQSWKSVMDAFAAAFPAKPLDVEVHPVLGSDQVAQEAVAYGRTALGNRFGVFAAWWSQKNATTVYPGMYQLLQGAAAQSYATVQMVASHTQTPDAFGDGGFPEAINLALQTGVRYLEIWNNDLVNPVLGPLLGETAARLSATVSLRVNGDANAAVTVTNPVTVDYSIRGGQGHEFFLVLDAPAMGRPWSYLNATGQWVRLPANLNDVTPFATAPADGDRAFYTGITVPPGAYSLCLGYDTVKNGYLDLTTATYDCVSATVQ